MMNLCPTCGWHACVAETMEVECPLCKTQFSALSHDDQGRNAWELLHMKQDADEEWFQWWLETAVPQYGCMCVTFVNAYTAHTPPVFEEGWFQWTVDLHNAVNMKLEKDTMTLEEALDVWQVSV